MKDDKGLITIGIVLVVFAVLFGLFILGSGIYMIIDGSILVAKGTVNVRSVGHLVVGIVFVLSSLLSGGARSSSRD